MTLRMMVLFLAVATVAGCGNAKATCGDQACDADGEICLHFVGLGGTTYECRAVPAECRADRSCSCLGDEICGEAGFVCVDTGDENVIGCPCPVC